MTATLTLLHHPWTYQDELEGDGTQVPVTHRLTGMVTIHRTHDDADRFTDRADVLDCLASQALSTAEGLATVEDKDAAWTALDKLLDLGAQLPSTAEAEYLCICGGLLATVGPAGSHRLAHVDTCPDEAFCRPCSGQEDHKTCPRPEAMHCEHSCCKRLGRVYAQPCQYGHDFCCGCCNGED